jgi:hypothetical protein
LHELALLPEDNRKKFIKTISEYAIQGEDLYALENTEIRKVFQYQEFEDLLQSVREQLLPKLAEVRLDWQNNRSSTEPPDEHMQQLLDSFETLKRHFGDEPNIAAIIEQEIHYANDWTAENMPDELDEVPRTLGKLESLNESHSKRSIFDDIDV